MVATFGRIGLLGSGTENDITYESFYWNNTWFIARYSPAPPALNQCACSTTFECPRDRGLFLCTYGNNCTAGTVVWTLPGLIRGCISLDHMFLSNLRCFYNQTCLNTMFAMYNVDIPDRLPLPAAIIGTSAMNASAPSYFSVTDDLATTFSQLMVEEWNIVDNFTGYYEACAPVVCNYISVQRLPIISVITNIIGLFGGLSVSLRLLITMIGRLLQLCNVRINTRSTNTNQSK